MKIRWSSPKKGVGQESGFGPPRVSNSYLLLYILMCVYFVSLSQEFLCGANLELLTPPVLIAQLGFTGKWACTITSVFISWLLMVYTLDEYLAKFHLDAFVQTPSELLYDRQGRPLNSLVRWHSSLLHQQFKSCIKMKVLV